MDNLQILYERNHYVGNDIGFGLANDLPMLKLV